MSDQSPVFSGVTPYLHYADLPAMIEWLTRVFGFVEKGRWQDETGATTNAEILAGTCEIWLDGTPDWWARRGRRPEEWIGVWVDDVAAMHERVVRRGIDAKPPEHKFYGVRILQVTDPEGYTWGFMQRSPFMARSPIVK
jgi:uncharacterized glyoxalase superfamily protein PhnB